MVEMNLGNILILALFVGGGATYIYALVEEGRSGAEFHVKLATFAAFLTIAATFAAIISGWLGG